MTKVQILYEKLTKIAFIFSGIFFGLFLIDLFIGMLTGAIDCDAPNNTLCIRESYTFFRVTIIPLAVGTLIFLVSGRIFYEFSHRKSKLMSASDYRKALEKERQEQMALNKDDVLRLYGQGKRKHIATQETTWQKITNKFNDTMAAIGDFFKDVRGNTKQYFANRKANALVKQKEKAEMARLKAEIEQKEMEQVLNTPDIQPTGKLNKTELIIKVANETGLDQNDTRTLLNAFIDTVRETLSKDEPIKIANFGRFEKVHIDEHDTTDELGNPIHIEEHNDIEFTAYKLFIEALNGEGALTEPDDEEELVQEEPVQEEPVQEEPVQEEPVQEEPVQEEPVQEEPVQEEPVQEEPVQEEPVQEEPVHEEPEQEESDDSEDEEEDDEEQQALAKKPTKAESSVTKPKPKKAKIVTRTKTDIIELLDSTTDLSKNKANKFLKYFAEVVKEGLADRQEIELPGIGFFTTIEMPAKEAVNPQTNEPIIVPAHYQVRLRFDDEFKDRVNEGK